MPALQAIASLDVKLLSRCLIFSVQCMHDLSNVYTWLSANKLNPKCEENVFTLIASRQTLSWTVSNLSFAPISLSGCVNVLCLYSAL